MLGNYNKIKPKLFKNPVEIVKETNRHYYKTLLILSIIGLLVSTLEVYLITKMKSYLAICITFQDIMEIPLIFILIFGPLTHRKVMTGIVTVHVIGYLFLPFNVYLDLVEYILESLIILRLATNGNQLMTLNIEK